VVVPLADDDAMLAAMHKKTRYNIRLAAKRGVTVERVTGEEMLEALPRWYRLYRETAARDRISIHSEQYYHTVLSTSVEMIQNGERAPRCALYFARHEDDLLAGIVVASWEGMSTYLYGAGADHKRNLMPSYLIQWETMRTARDAGDRAYDLFGIPPGADPDHPMHGLYRFKTGFGGEIVHRPGCWDIDVARGWGRAFRTAERARAWYHHDFRKRVGA
jgi:lipid II:glycine glycyltransferase (peptidoglycan interpeptide bridge formation enzyme)